MFEQAKKSESNQHKLTAKPILKRINSERSPLSVMGKYTKKLELAHKFHSMKTLGFQETIQREEIDGIDVYVDKGYPVWESENFGWHLTMKDEKRWHITKDDRSDSYWFKVDGGFIGGVNPKKSEYGNHKDKHHNLVDAPDGQFEFIRDNLYEIMAVTDKKSR